MTILAYIISDKIYDSEEVADLLSQYNERASNCTEPHFDNVQIDERFYPFKDDSSNIIKLKELNVNSTYIPSAFVTKDGIWISLDEDDTVDYYMELLTLLKEKYPEYYLIALECHD